MASKWAKLKSQFPKMPVDADYSEKINAILNAPVPFDDLIGIGETIVPDVTVPLRTYALKGVVRVYNYYRDEKERLENELSTLQAKLEAAEFCIEEYYDAHDLLTQKFEDGSSITVAPDPVVNVVDEVAFYAWVLENADRKRDYKMREYVHPGTAKAQVKTRLENKELLANDTAVPPGVKVFYQNKLTRRSGG